MKKSSVFFLILVHLVGLKIKSKSNKLLKSYMNSRCQNYLEISSTRYTFNKRVYDLRNLISPFGSPLLRGTPRKKEREIRHLREPIWRANVFNHNLLVLGFFFLCTGVHLEKILSNLQPQAEEEEEEEKPSREIRLSSCTLKCCNLLRQIFPTVTNLVTGEKAVVVI